MTSKQRNTEYTGKKGNQSPDWRQTELGDILSFRNGKGSAKSKGKEDGKYPIYGANGTIARTDEILEENPVIIVGRVGAYCGNVQKTEGKSWATDNTMVVRAEDVDLDFAYHMLSNLKLNRYRTGTSQPLLTQSSLKDINVEIPDKNEQKKIGKILTTIDEKIENNDEIGLILEEMAQALFKSWFVDFDPYEDFKQSDIGQLPEKFSIRNLESVLSFQRGYSYSGDELIDDESELQASDGYPMINLGTISPGGGYNEDGIKYCKELPKNMYRAKPGDLVISHTDMTQDLDILGSPVIVPGLIKDEMLFSHHLYKVVDSNLPIEYLYFYFLSPYFKPKAENFASGTTVLSFSSKIASDVKIPIPPESELERFVQKIRPIFKTKEEIRKENRNLADLRDTLLPKLMSGEIRVNDIELDELEVDSEV